MIPSVLGMSNVSVADSGASMTENVKKKHNILERDRSHFFGGFDSVYCSVVFQK